MTRVADLMQMQGRVALVTGAAGGIGRVIAQTLAELGAELLLLDRSPGPLAALAEELGRTAGARATAIVCDLESGEERAAAIARIDALPAGLSVLINNAAFVGTSDLQGWATAFEQQSVETWRRALEVNLTAAFDLCKGLTPALRRGPGANIINIASIYGELGPDWRLYEGTPLGNPAAYGASKGGILQLTRWLATTLAPQIRVNSISPGGVFRNQPEAFVRRYEARTPLGRMAREEDFAGAIAYLASDLARYVTGQNIGVDGGWGTW